MKTSFLLSSLSRSLANENKIQRVFLRKQKIPMTFASFQYITKRSLKFLFNFRKL